MLDRELYRLQIDALHYEKASVLLVNRSLTDFSFPFGELCRFDRPNGQEASIFVAGTMAAIIGRMLGVAVVVLLL